MKIIIFSKQYWPVVGGVVTGSRTMARSLAKAGHEVTVFTSTSSQDSELAEGYEICRSSSLVAFVRLAFKADLIIIRGGVSAFAGLGGFLARRPKIVVWHEMAGSYLHPGTRWRVGLSNLLRQQIVRRASAHVALTRACLESKNLPLSIRSYVIPTPVDDELTVSSGMQCGDHCNVDVLFVGRIIEGKGIFTLAKALGELAAEGGGLRVKFVGDGEDRRRLEEQIDGISGMSAVFTGNQAGGALADSYQSSKILVVPSTTHPEGQAIVIAEGMSFGLPVIVSDQAPMIEVVGDAGIVVPAGDQGALASAIKQLLQDRALWANLSERARRRSTTFNTVQFEESTGRLIAEIATTGQNRI